MIKFTIYGQLASMKNRRVPSRSNPFVTHMNASAAAFKRDFMMQVPRQICDLHLGRRANPKDKPILLRASVRAFYQSWRSDLDVELIWDLLQEAGVIDNDRWIREKHVYGLEVDPKNPRIEIEIELI